MTNGFGNFGFPTRFMLGFDEMVANVSQELLKQSYPPHNIIKHEDNSYTIELAVAGYSRSELNVYADEGDFIVIKGAKELKDTDSVMIHKGISNKDFEIKFKVIQNASVATCGIVDGILRIKISPPTKATAQRVSIPIS